MRPIPAPYEEASPPAEETLFAVIAAAARRRSDGVLVVWAAAGAVGAVATGIVLPRFLLVFLISLCAAAFGLWGIVDRELADATAVADAPARRVRILRVVRGVVTVFGTAAGAATVLAGLAIALGTWVS